MDRQILNFTANEQILTCDNPIKISTNKVNYIEARFDLGQNWTGYDSVRAVWFNDFQCISTVLNSQGITFVPFEVLKRKGIVKVNLVGSISEDDVLTDRLTSYPVVAVVVDCIAQITGANTSPITPSEYEQFVASVRNDADRAEQGASDAGTYANNAQGYAQNASESATSAENYASDAEDARDEIRNMSANATTLPSGSDATASYSDGVLSLGIPQGIQGEKGDNGDTGATPNLTIGTVETLEPTESATATITGTDENPVLNLGLPKGEQGEVSLDELSALLPTDTALGDIASFSDGTDLFPALSVKAQIEPIQSGSGTPSPDNVRPISGHTECVTSVSGVNVWDEEWESGRIDPSNGIPIISNNNIRSKNYISVLPNMVYYWHCTVNNVMCFYDANETFISTTYLNANQSFTTPSNASYMKFYCASSYGTTYNHDISINYPSTDHDYHAYDGTSYTTALGRTVYGGTLDVVSGELVVDRAMVDAGSLNWVRYNSSNYYTFYTDELASVIKKDPAAKIAMSSMYKSESQNGASTSADNYIWVNGSGMLAVKDTTHLNMTASEYKAFVSGQQIVYELATPQTYQLDPQTIDLLLGQNNLWTDCGSVEVTYKADIQRWVLKKLSE